MRMRMLNDVYDIHIQTLYQKQKVGLGPSSVIPNFSGLSLTLGYVPTCSYLVCHGSKPIRLACLIHAASIHPELGSNSKLKRDLKSPKWLVDLVRLWVIGDCTYYLHSTNIFKDKTKENARFWTVSKNLIAFVYRTYVFECSSRSKFNLWPKCRNLLCGNKLDEATMKCVKCARSILDLLEYLPIFTFIVMMYPAA